MAARGGLTFLALGSTELAADWRRLGAADELRDPSMLVNRFLEPTRSNM